MTTLPLHTRKIKKYFKNTFRVLSTGTSLKNILFEKRNRHEAKGIIIGKKKNDLSDERFKDFSQYRHRHSSNKFI